jgi:hypothetical protein
MYFRCYIINVVDKAFLTMTQSYLNSYINYNFDISVGLVHKFIPSYLLSSFPAVLPISFQDI